MKVAIVGCRNYNNYEEFKQKISEFPYEITTIISGGATGADTLAEKYAEDYNIEIVIFHADWSMGRKAGPIRNTKIVDSCDALIAFPSKTSKGYARLNQKSSKR